MWQYLVERTNLYAEKKLSTMTVSDRSLYRNWKPVSVDEMKGFITVILNMGIVQLANVKDYWSTDDTTNFPFFRSVFSRDRFLQIFGMFHVGDSDSGTKRGKIQPLLDRLCPVFESVYTPAQHIAIDESVISFKGRVSFRQYLKGKPHPWGIKAFVLSESATGYLQRVCVYFGKETQLVNNDHPHTVRVVQTLVEPFHSKGYDLYVDRFYTSPLLATELQKVGITITGTVQANRRGFPKDITAKRKVPRGTVAAARAGDILVLSWMDKRKVLMLSTKHNASKITVHTRYTHTYNFLYLSVSLSILFSFSFLITLSLTLSLFPSLSPSLSICLSLPLSLSLSFPPYLSVSPALSLSFPLSRTPSPSPSLHSDSVNFCLLVNN